MHATLDEMAIKPTQAGVHEQIEHMRQQHLNAYSHIVDNAVEREVVFNKALDLSHSKKGAKIGTEFPPTLAVEGGSWVRLLHT